MVINHVSKSWEPILQVEPKWPWVLNAKGPFFWSVQTPEDKQVSGRYQKWWALQNVSPFKYGVILGIDSLDFWMEFSGSDVKGGR